MLYVKRLDVNSAGASAKPIPEAIVKRFGASDGNFRRDGTSAIHS